MRVERIYCKQKSTARKHAPWAARIVRVSPTLFVAYESADEAAEWHSSESLRTKPAGRRYLPVIGAARLVDGKVLFRCGRCGLNKPDSDYFHRKDTHQRISWCLSCRRAYDKQYRQNRKPNLTTA